MTSLFNIWLIRVTSFNKWTFHIKEESAPKSRILLTLWIMKIVLFVSKNILRKRYFLLTVSTSFIVSASEIGIHRILHVLFVEPTLKNDFNTLLLNKMIRWCSFLFYSIKFVWKIILIIRCLRKKESLTSFRGKRHLLSVRDLCPVLSRGNPLSSRSLLISNHSNLGQQRIEKSSNMAIKMRNQSQYPMHWRNKPQKIICNPLWSITPRLGTTLSTTKYHFLQLQLLLQTCSIT